MPESADAMAPTAPLDEPYRSRYRRLCERMAGLERVVVAYSGGVDSSLVAYVAARTLGERALAVTSGSASLKRSDLTLAETLAQRWGMRHRVIVTDEVSQPGYRANPVNRCFFCKTTLYAALQAVAAEESGATIINGTNCDDLGDHRPGLIAADDHGVVAPLVDAGFHKADVRAVAAWLGLDNADKPQSACLSSRFPYGVKISEPLLAQVEAAEEVLAGLGFRQFRVRHHETVARVEIAEAELPAAFAARQSIDDGLRACGYRYVALDLRGFRSGSLNDGLIDTVSSDAGAIRRPATQPNQGTSGPLEATPNTGKTGD